MTVMADGNSNGTILGDITYGEMINGGTTMEDGLRKSRRVRTSTVFYGNDEIPPPRIVKPKSKKKSLVKKDAKSTESETKAGEAGSKTSKPSPAPAAPRRKPVNPPKFIKLESPYPEDIFWIKLSLREFIVRFEKLCRLPTRHGSIINDPNEEWDSKLSKAIIVAFVRIIANDIAPLVPETKLYLQQIERTNADSDEIWEVLAGYLGMENEKRDESDEQWGVLRYHLKLLRRLLLITTQTETIRLNIQEDAVLARQYQQDTQNEVKRLKAAWDAQVLKLESTKPDAPGPDLNKWQDRYVGSKRYNQARTRRAEVTGYFKVRKNALRTSIIGYDTFDNEYWILQQKSKDITSWGSWVIVIKGDKVSHPSGSTEGPSQGRLWYISGKQEVSQLANWVKAQSVPPESNSKAVPPLARELYRFAEFGQEAASEPII